MPPLALMLGTYVAAALPRLRLALEGVVPRGPRRAIPAAWGAGALGVFLLLLVAVHQLLPGYHRRFALRGQVRVHRMLAADRQLPVACYPHGWDSVSFYLGRNDVRVYTPGRRAQFIADLRARPRTLVFVKSEHYLQDLVRSLPPPLEFVPYPRQGPIVTSGLVRRRADLADDVVAQLLRRED
jgi:hypothetical protein